MGNNEKKKYPSVTTIINENYGWNKNILLNWYYKELKAGRDPKSKTQKAADIGNLCHEYIYYYETKKDFNTIDLSKYPFDAPIIAEAGLNQYLKIKSEKQIEILFSETSYISEKYKYNGRIDLCGKVNQTLSLIDGKTSKTIYPDQLIQLGAYYNLLKENGIEVNLSFILHIDKNPLTIESKIVELVLIPQNIIDCGFEIFKMFLKLHDMKENFHL
jgi:hypothetical protein